MRRCAGTVTPRNRIVIRDLTSGRVTRLATGPCLPASQTCNASHLVFSPNGRQVAYSWRELVGTIFSSLRLIANENGAKPRTLVRGGDAGPSPEGPGFQIAPLDWSPDGRLCAASGIGKDGVESSWFWFDLSARTISSLGDDPARADRLQVSPDGRYLAVQVLSEALTEAHVIDLPARIRDRTYRVVAELGAFPGWVAIEGWMGNRTLRVTSDMLLSHPPQGASRRDLYVFGDPERFAWSIDTGAVVAEATALRDPVRYSCDHLAAPHPRTRLIAVYNLSVLPRSTATACLETALSSEADTAVRQEILWALSERRRR